MKRPSESDTGKAKASKFILSLSTRPPPAKPKPLPKVSTLSTKFVPSGPVPHQFAERLGECKFFLAFDVETHAPNGLK